MTEPTEAKPSEPAKHKHTNRLAKEASPYLQQHQHNPVDWYPWGKEAFDKAKAEDKPILLSIGYSTCHWCHVMERESFEDEATAKVMNEHFVCIKLDREERPDVDKIYMTFVQATTGGGGWPLNVWLTPELKPFYGGTYYPPVSKFGRPSFTDVLTQIGEAWKTQRKEIVESATDISQRIGESVALKAREGIKLDPAWLDRAVERFKSEYDPRYGGFGDAPKFPRPSQPLMLLRHAHRTGDQDAINMVLHTCDKMAAGGMYDQIGGGFARYSVDAKWLVPHFEKMLYDNAQLLHLYLDAHLISGDKKHADVAHDILRYILRDMRHKDGGFYSAEDADSEGKEGKFYCWTEAELKALLTEAEFVLAKRYYGLTEHGNFEDHSDPEPLKNQNVLSIVSPELTDDERALLDSAKQKMFDERAKRVRPHLDDKILSSWNGLMLGAVARAAIVLNEPKYLEAAEANLAFLLGGAWLLYRRVFTWHAPIAMLAALALCALMGYDGGSSQSGGSALFHLFSGATMFAAFFIITDPVSSAVSNKGRLIFGALIGVLVYLIRTLGNYPDAVAFAVLILNFCAPFIDHYTQPKVYGTGSRES